MSEIVANTEEFVADHKGAMLAIVGAIVLVWLFSRSSSGASAAPATSADQTAAAQLAGAQIAANSQTAVAKISADAQTAQAQAASDVAQSDIQAQLAAALAQVSSNTTIATAQANAAVGVSANQAVAAEFTSVANSLGQYASTVSTNETNQNIAAIAANNSIATTFLNDFYGAYQATSLKALDMGLGTVTPPGWAGTVVGSEGTVVNLGGAPNATQTPQIAGFTNVGNIDIGNAFQTLAHSVGGGITIPTHQ